MSTAPSFKVEILSLQSANDLCRMMEENGIAGSRELADGKRFGDAALFNVVAPMVPGILAVLSAFILSRPHVKESGTTLKFEQSKHDGTTTKLELKVSATDIEPKGVSEGILKQLMAFFPSAASTSASDSK